MRSLVCAILLFATAAAAVEISSYDIRLTTQPDGQGAGVAVIDISGSTGGTLTVPLAFATATSMQLIAAPAGTRFSAQRANEQTRLQFDMPPTPPRQVRIEVGFHVPESFTDPVPAAGQKRVLPAGSRMFVHGLVNTELVTIRHYRCAVIFPEQVRAQAVREALPELDLKESEPRVRLMAIDGRGGAVLRANALHQGDSASMRVELTRKARSPLWFVAGLLFSLVYLVYFRDLVAAPSATRRDPVSPSGD